MQMVMAPPQVYYSGYSALETLVQVMIKVSVLHLSKDLSQEAGALMLRAQLLQAAMSTLQKIMKVISVFDE